MAEPKAKIGQGEKSEVAKREEETLAFWKEARVFEKSLEKDAPKGEFTFYDGPPFATGLPHSGSLLSSVSKDLIPRYKTMRGYRVRRRWGWDTHGLPIENLVEKKLGLKSKKDILAVGIEKFNETARSMVLEYVHDWKRYVERVGRFVDFDNSYKTMDNTFIESVWWGLKRIHDKGRLYEGRKVLLYCPHCETPLAKAEIAMDNTYKDVTEEAVTIKFRVKNPQKHGLPENTFLLAWTTTPWTLPGNVALAVGPDIEYGITEENGAHLIRAGKGMKGSELVGIEYEPLYEIAKVATNESKKKWTVLSADFVNTEDGTGIVHTAVIYGEDDYQLGLKEGLPMVPLLNSNATYNDDAPEFLRGQYIKKAEPLIKEDLEKRGLLFAKAPNTHSYPHCYRCGTALIYNAVSSWFINIQAVKEKMLAENEKICWIPGHLKEGRFRHNIETAPDWTISRNRFWASPLPIWKDSEGALTVIGSLNELKARTKKGGNKYFVMRHGEADNVLLAVNSAHPETELKHHLTEEGKKSVRESATKLPTIEVIIASPFVRTQETAALVAEAQGLEASQVLTDDRLHDIDTGVLDGKPIKTHHDFYTSIEDRFARAPEGAETFADVRRRMGEFLYDIETKYSGKTILIVSHGDPLWLLDLIVQGGTPNDLPALTYPMLATPKELPFVPLPHNKDYELDFHLPYIDRVPLVSEAGKLLTRIPEVVDCWVESGSMPFAEYHYPFENKETFEKRSPGDFVSEYIGQTRAWFYYMHAMSAELFDTLAFRNVITTGNVLAGDGAKLSKSKGNYTDPYELFDAYGADAFRYYIMASVVMQAEDLTFRDEEVREIGRMVNMLRNVLSFYELFKQDASTKESAGKSTHPLDRWILARMDGLVGTVTEAFDAYDVPRGARPMREFIDDLSTWYVRRSRDRVKNGGEDTEHALATLRHVLLELSKVIAPVMPFIAEEIFQSVRNEHDPESVHLADWPRANTVAAEDIKLVEEMSHVRSLASEGLQLRQKADVKVRQPLASLSISGELSPDLAKILAEEVNAKEIKMGAAEVALDLAMTPELLAEGDARAFARAVAEARKSLELSPQDVAHAVKIEDGPYTAELSTGPVRFRLDVDAT